MGDATAKRASKVSRTLSAELVHDSGSPYKHFALAIPRHAVGILRPSAVVRLSTLPSALMCG
jgi:hypothetical protein